MIFVIDKDLHVISKKIIREFVFDHPESKVVLSRWFKKMKKSNPEKVIDIINMFKGTDYIGNDRFVFNICGNKYRLVALINFCKKKVFIRFIGTHDEYSEINSKII